MPDDTPPHPHRGPDEDGEPLPAPDDGHPAGVGASGETAGEGPDGTAPSGTPSDELETLRQRHLRLGADFDNFRKRSAREAADRSRYAAEDAARALLPVLDNLRRALDHAPADTAPALLDGLRATMRQFDEALASVGVVPIEALGRPFDPSLHEAVMGEESPDVEVDTVAAELQRGYLLHDRVLRPAMVKVAHPAAPATA